MVVHPFLSGIAQKKLTDNNGFFCNIGRIYTGHYNGIIDDFREEGIETGSVVITGDIIGIYESLREDIENRNFKFYDTAIKIFDDEALNFFLRKIRGIINFAILKNHFVHLEKANKELIELGLIDARKMSEQDKEILKAVPLVYFIFLFRPFQHITISKLANSQKRYPELKYYKKLNKDKKQDFARDAARYLQKEKFIKLASKDKWYADDLESPYPTKRDILDSIEEVSISI